MREKTEKKMAVMAGILLGVSAVVMLITHHLVPFMMDDLWYSTMLSDETPITSFSDIVKSQIWHYNNWGGRSMTHGILQLTLLMGENVVDARKDGNSVLYTTKESPENVIRIAPVAETGIEFADNLITVPVAADGFLIAFGTEEDSRQAIDGFVKKERSGWLHVVSVFNPYWIIIL